ncbi:MAG: TonB-dependent receptor domain-containing protein [Opitutaceae bacterium]
MKSLSLTVLLLLPLAFVAVTSAQVQGPGTVQGRIFNPATGEYVRNAVIRTDGGTTAVSGSGGEYRLFPVGPGTATLSVTYTGYQTVSAQVTVAPGATVARDFELVSTLAAPGTGEAVKLDAFVVASQREGAAKAIMDQRNSMNVTNTVASDSFGDNAEGNVGEFLKHLPGVELETFFGEVRTVRLGGLPSDYTAVTMDGMPLASVDAGTTTRAFTMEMASLNSVESIEIAKTISADVDANAPAGTINLRTKRAFDRAGRRVSWQANITAHSEAFNFRRSLGPDEDHRTMKLRPGGIFEYSDIFLDKRLGVVLNVSESNVYQDAITANMAYSTTTSATDLRPLVPTSVTYQWAPRFNKRFAITLAADYKFDANLNVGLGLVYNYVDLWTPQRNVVFNVGARSNVAGNDPVLSFTSAPNGSVQTNPIAVAKLGETTTLLPRFSYRRGNFELEGRASYSDSTSWYDPLGRRGSIRDFNGPTAPNITFRAQRSGPLAADWKITQIAGPDISNGASFSSPVFTTNDGRFARTQLISGDLIASLKTEAVRPIIWKTGLKRRYQSQKFEDDTLARRYDLIGNPTTGGWANYPTPWPFNIGMSGGSITSLSSGGLFMPSVRALGQMFADNPGPFRQNWGSNATNFYESYVARRRRLSEQVDAGFLMGTTTWNRLTARAGLRWEGTTTEASEPNTRTPAEVRAAGFPVNASGVATTVEGLAYQFLSRPRSKRAGTYDNFFPSASLKYQFAPSLDGQLGFSSTIRRPPYANLAGVWIVNETLRTVTAPNAALKPETSKNFTGRLAYYFEPVGLLAVTATQRNVKNIFITDTLTAQEFGYSGNDELQAYDFITTRNGRDTTRVRSFELEYNQSLGFLGSLFKRLTVRGSYTRAYAAIRTPGITPRLASGGLYYTLNRLQVYANYNWADDWLRNLQTNVYRRHRSNLDLGGSWRLSQTYQLSASVRNVLDQPWIDMQPFSNGFTAMTAHQTVGVSWTFALKGTY